MRQNVFHLLGLDADEATVEAWRADFATIVRDAFKESRLSQSEFAKNAGITQSVLSPIVNGNVSRVSVEFLLKLCVRLGRTGIARWGPEPDRAHVELVHPALVAASATNSVEFIVNGGTPQQTNLRVIGRSPFRAETVNTSAIGR